MRRGLYLLVALCTATCSRPLDVGSNAPTLTSMSVRLLENRNNKVDLLFMVDNSPSMGPMQAELIGKMSAMLQVFSDLAAAGTNIDLHLGVVTSDYGAGDYDGVALATDQVTGKPAGCLPSPGPGPAWDAIYNAAHSPAVVTPSTGEGLLQAIGDAAAPGCAAPTGGVPYIAYAYGASGTNNLPAGQDLAATFTCMAAVGANGCGFESPLESVHAALEAAGDPSSINHGFLRDDALLAVVFLTNEDDGSVPPLAPVYRQDDHSLPFDTFRQTHYGIECGNPLALPDYVAAQLTDCVPSPAGSTQVAEYPATHPDAGGNDDDGIADAGVTATVTVPLAFDITRYIDFFTKPLAQGGIKADPRDVVLIALDATDSLVEVDEVNEACGSETYTPASSNGGHTCLKHSCQNALKPEFFGDPAVRLNAVVRASTTHAVASICGDALAAVPDYAAALGNVGSLAVATNGNGCFTGPVVGGPSDANCTVQQVTTNANGSTTTALPRCDQTPSAFPCWTVTQKSTCVTDTTPCGYGITVNRNGAPTPSNVSVQGECKPSTTAETTCITP